MATITSVKIDMLGIEKRVKTAVRDLCIGAAAVCADRLVMNTPVDTGQARGNWNVTLGGKKSKSAKRNSGAIPVAGGGVFLDPDGHVTLEAINMVLKNVKTGDYITIYNDVPYINMLENGHSQQSPAGMTTGALATVRGMTGSQLLQEAIRRGLVDASPYRGGRS